MIDVPVLIVGGGPVGLTTSIFLSRFGIRSLLVERHPGTAVLPKARALNARTMEMYRQLDLARRVRGMAVEVACRRSGGHVRRGDPLPPVHRHRAGRGCVMGIEVSRIHHFTIGCTVEELPRLLAFYTRTLGLEDGYRPALRHPGHWLYADGEAIVHLNALLQTSQAHGAGPVDHVALQARGLAATRRALRAADVEFRETPLKGTRLHQVFVRDPLGVVVELNFDLTAEESVAGAGA